MTPELYDDLERDEGLRLIAYCDTQGLWTIGYGHRPAAPGQTWTQQEARDAFYQDVARTVSALDAEIPWWRTLDDVRQDVVCEMAFNLGVGVPPCPAHPEGTGLQAFVNTLHFMVTKDYSRAASAMLASKWATQVHDRAIRLAFMMKTGARPAV